MPDYQTRVMTVEGLDQLNVALAQAGERIEEAASAALWREATDLIAESVPLVPWKEGILAGSHFVRMPDADANGVFVEFGYGGGSIAYAVIQHESTGFQHPKGGQAKYLSSVLERHERSMGVELAAHVRWFVSRTNLGA